jgi:membrane fusion protein (multidrug efflux system)
VRVRLDAKELVDHPLRLGLSMEARVDVSKTDGRMLADAAAASQEVQTAVFEQDNREADTRVQQIIGQHGGGTARATAAVRKPAAPAAPAIPVVSDSLALVR